MLTYITLFTLSCILIIFAGNIVVSSISFIARYLKWKEFVVAFFALSLGAVAPEFFIGIVSALNGVPELSLGNILGQNILLLSVAVAVPAFLLKGGIRVESHTVRSGSVFAVVAAALPLLLLLDGSLSVIDGAVLILAFIFFNIWLFSNQDYFRKVYETEEQQPAKINTRDFVIHLSLLLVGMVLIIFSAEGIIRASLGFAELMDISIPLIGMFIVALGTGLPETYVAARLALEGQSWMILGGLMGAVAISSTLVLGTVSIIEPIVVDITSIPQLGLARIFLLAVGILFLLFTRTNRTLSNREGVLLFVLYTVFLALSVIM